MCKDSLSSEDSCFTKDWIKLWNYIAEIINVFTEYLDKKGKFKELSEEERIGLAVNIITWGLRAPVFIDPVPHVVISPYKLYILELIRKYVSNISLIDLIRHMRKERIFSEKYKDEYRLLKKLFGKQGVCAELEKWLSGDMEVSCGNVEKKVKRWIYILGYPADTRPGYNTTSLIVHSLLVSGIAWALAENENLSKEDSLLYALAGLLHDIGKPIDTINHVKAGVEFLQQNNKLNIGIALKKLIGEKAFNRVINIIKEHHNEDSGLARIIRIADRLAAGEREIKLVEEYLVKKGDLTNALKEIAGKVASVEEKEFLEKASRDPLVLYDKGRFGEREIPWRAFVWTTIGYLGSYGYLEKLTREFARSLWRVEAEELKKIYSAGEGGSESVSVIKIDIRNIQSTIASSLDLRITAVSSYLIDYWLLAYLPAVLYRDYYMPLSAVVMASGGNGLILMPSRYVSEVMESIENKYNNIEDIAFRLSVVAVSTQYTPFYAYLSSKLDEEIALKKLMTKINKVTYLHPGIGERCDLCDSRPALFVIRVGAEYKNVCPSCFIKWGIASNIVYGNYKLGSKIVVDNIELYIYDILSHILEHKMHDDERVLAIFNLLMEVLSGLPPDERLIGRYLNYAVLNIDGNLIGYYMGRSKTFTEAVEKSYRIDYALKDSLRNFAKTLEHALSKELQEYTDEPLMVAAMEIARLYLGVLYMGGDDAKIIAPSYLAIPLALALAKGYCERMGCTSTLSIGIAAAPPKHHIWGLNQASKGLLDIAKENIGRIHAAKAIHGTAEAVGALAFFNTESTSMLTRDRIKEFYRSLLEEDNGEHGRQKEKPIVVKAFAIGGRGVDDIVSIISKIILGSKDMIDIDSLIKELIVRGYFAIINQCSRLADLESRYECVRYYVKGATDEDIIYVLKRSEEVLDELKNVRKVINDILMVYDRFKGGGAALEATIIYAKRQKHRTGLEIYDHIADILTRSIIANSPAPLLNIQLLIKLIGGGAL